MSEDLEVKALQQVVSVLSDLEDESRRRVIGYVIDKYDLAISMGAGNEAASMDREEVHPSGKDESNLSSLSSYDSVSEVIANSIWETAAEKVLLAAAFLQKIGGTQTLTAKKIDEVLSNSGHNVGDVNREIGRLTDEQPQQMRQVGNEGRANAYKVTKHGLKKVEEILSRVVKD